MNNQQGLTLVELLAVIVIIPVFAMIMEETRFFISKLEVILILN